MKTLNISISELEYNTFGLKKNKLSFSDFLDIISRQLLKQELHKTVQLAEKYNLATMTMDDISKEVKDSRKNAKGHH